MSKRGSEQHHFFPVAANYLHWPAQPVSFRFLCLLPLEASKPFLLYVCENYSFPGNPQKINTWVSHRTKYKVTFSPRHLLSSCGTNSAKVCFCCILTKTLLFASNILISLYDFNLPLVWMVLSPAQQRDLKASSSRLPNPTLCTMQFCWRKSCC